jgi:hypothetical protein
MGIYISIVILDYFRNVVYLHLYNVTFTPDNSCIYISILISDYFRDVLYLYQHCYNRFLTKCRVCISVHLHTIYFETSCICISTVMSDYFRNFLYLYQHSDIRLLLKCLSFVITLMLSDYSTKCRIFMTIQWHAINFEMYYMYNKYTSGKLWMYATLVA